VELFSTIPYFFKFEGGLAVFISHIVPFLLFHLFFPVFFILTLFYTPMYVVTLLKLNWSCCFTKATSSFCHVA